MTKAEIRAKELYVEEREDFGSLSTGTLPEEDVDLLESSLKYIAAYQCLDLPRIYLTKAIRLNFNRFG